MSERLRESAKAGAHLIATVLVLPALLSYAVRRPLLGADRALEGSTQALALIPGVVGQYLRRAFLARVLAGCHRTATIAYGTLFSEVNAVIEERVYVGPACHLGFVHLEKDVMLAAGVHVPSGGRIHGTADVTKPMRDQPGVRTLVRIGAGSWIGSGAVVMADVGADSIVGAGAVVTRPIPARVVAGGVPARVLRERGKEPGGPDPAVAQPST